MRIAPFTILAASVSVAGCLAACHRQKPPPSINGLSAALERSADKTLALPSLDDDQFIVPARPGQTGDQTREIEALVNRAGGTALDSTTPQGDISILAQVPQNRVLLFRSALERIHGRELGAEPVPLVSGTGSSPLLIEVLIENTSPSPSP
jgi:hypothetical protein